MTRRWGFVGATFAAGTCVLLAAVDSLWRGPADHRWLMLAALTWMSAPLALRVPGAHMTLTISESLSFVIALGFGWAPAVLTVAVDGLLASLRQRPRRIDRILFNVTEPAVSMLACAVVLDWVSGLTAVERLGAPLSRLLVPGFAATTSYLLMNSALTAVAVALESRTSAITAWFRHANFLVLDYLGGTSLALLVVASANDLGFWDVVTALPLLAALHGTYRSTIRRAGEALRYAERLKRLYMATVESLAMAIDAKDHVTRGHIGRVKSLATRVARALDLRDEALLSALEAGALLHDVGKLGVPDHILNKPGPLTPDEYDQIKRHTVVGADIVGAVDFPYPVAPIVRHHHENWDGSGYPDGLRGDDIPVGARILSVIDCYDALTSDRPYRRAMSHDDAMVIVTERRGTMYDPAVVDAFESLGKDGVQACLQASASVEAPASAPAPTRAVTRSDPPTHEGRVADDVRWTDADRARLVEVGATLAQHLSIDAVMDLLVHQLTHATPASLVAVFGAGAAGESLELRCARGAGASGLDALRPIVGRGLSGWVAAHRRSLLNAETALEFPGAAVPDQMPRRALSVPILFDERVVGVVTLYADGRGFSADDQALVEDIAAAIAPAMSLAASVTARTAPALSRSREGVLPGGAALEHLMDVEGRAGAALFESAAVLVVDHKANAAVTRVAADIVRHAFAPGDVVFQVDATRLVVVSPQPATGDRFDLRACASRVANLIHADANGVAVGVACAPEDGQSLTALVGVAEQRQRLALLDGNAASGSGSATVAETLAS